MKKLPFILLAMLCMLAFNVSFAQDQEQRIQSSYIIAFNKTATPDEVNYWKGQGNLNMDQLLARHKAYIAANPGIFDGIINVSYTDAFGKPPTAGEKAYHIKYPRTYTEMMAAHMQYLNGNPALYDDVIKSSYKGAFGRQPSDPELQYWRGQKKAAYIWLFRAHLEYARTNMRSNKASVSGVKTITVAPSILTESRTAISKLVGNDGASLIGNDGSTLLAAGSGGLIGNDGSTMVAAGGLN